MTFEEKVKKYFELDQLEKQAKKEKTSLNSAIKAHMKENNFKKLEIDGVKVDFSVQERTAMNEDRLLVKLKALGLSKAIKTVEKPDSDAVTQLIYDGELSTTDLDACVEKKFVEVLKVSGGKKK